MDTKIRDWGIEKRQPLGGWEFAEVFTGTWENATARAAKILDTVEVFEVRVGKFLSHKNYTYLPQWIS